MTTRKLYSLSGLALLIAGILTPLAQIIHPSNESTSTILAQTGRLVAGHAISTIAIILILMGLAGLYLYEAEAAGNLGLIGFILAFTGNILLATSGNYGFIAPVLAARAPELLNAINLYPPETVLDAAMVQTYLVGFLLLGIATYRARRFPRWTGLLLAVSPFMFFIFSAISLGTSQAWLYWIGVLGQVLFGLALIACGWQLWKGNALLAG